MSLTRVDVLSVLNTLLDANYTSIDNVPDKALCRAITLLQIEILLRDLEDRGVPVQVFMCGLMDLEDRCEQA